jgi:NADH dehydrogenase/NADH:ubiquinone oxidoreductase subunit G
MTVGILVDDRELTIKENRSVLQACLENGIYIPNLCSMEDLPHPEASCRLCFVEVAGINHPVTACTIRVSDGMIVKTDTPPVRRLQRRGLRLLLSVHDIDCKNCPANKKCELQHLARFLKTGLKSKDLETFLKEVTVVDSHPCLTYYPNRCVLCAKCIHECRLSRGQSLISFVGRGFNTSLTFAGELQSAGRDCSTCRACADICPVGALILKTDVDT